MRTSLWLTGIAIGAGVGYYALRRKRGEQAEHRAKPELEPKHRIQTEEEAAQVEAMLEDVAHRDDIPDTPVKHAFEEALHEHPGR